MYIYHFYFYITGQDVKLVCSGCDHVLRIGNTAYYCPGSEAILFFRCDVTNETSFTLKYNDGIFVADSTDSPTSRIDGVFSIQLQSVEADGFFANFTTLIWFDTADIMDSITITCESFEDIQSIIINPVGKEFIITHACLYVYVSPNL